jgi:predicted DNA-binding transcriptional regulator AlpA
MIQCMRKHIAELNHAPAVPAANTGKRYLSDREVAERYGLNVRTLQNWRIFGKGPKFRKFGRSTKYDVRDIEAWLETLPCGGDGVPACAVKRSA